MISAEYRRFVSFNAEHKEKTVLIGLLQFPEFVKRICKSLHLFLSTVNAELEQPISSRQQFGEKCEADAVR